MKIKIAEASELVIDFLVAKCEEAIAKLTPVERLKLLLED